MQSSPGGTTPRTPRGGPAAGQQSPPGGTTPRTPRGMSDEKSNISDMLADEGLRKIHYSERIMPTLAALASRFAAERPFDGMTVAACLHVTAETAVLARVLRAGGARVALAASNPLSTQDDIAAALAVHEVSRSMPRRAWTATPITSTSRGR